MADEDSDQRTLEASEHRLREATLRGEWPATDAFALALTWPLVAAGLVLVLPWMGRGMKSLAQQLWCAEAFGPAAEPGGATIAGGDVAGAIAGSSAAPLVAALFGLSLLLVTGVTLAHLAQKGFVFKDPFASAGLTPRLPLATPGQAAGKIAGGLARLGLASVSLYVVAAPFLRDGATLPLSGHELLSTLSQLLALTLLFGGVDYAIRRRAFLVSMRMTPAEARTEAKQLDGDPRVKGAIRQRAMRPIGASPFRTVLMTDGDAVAVVMLFEDSGHAPRLCLAARGEGGLRLKEQYVAQDAPIVPAPGLASLVPGLRPMDAVPASLHAALAALHRDLFPGGEA